MVRSGIDAVRQPGVGVAGCAVFGVEVGITFPVAGFGRWLPAIVTIGLVDSGVGGCGIGRYAAEAIHVLLVARAGLTDLVVVVVASPGAVGGGIPALFERVPRHGHLDAHRGGMGRSGIVAGPGGRVGGAREAVFGVEIGVAFPVAGFGCWLPAVVAIGLVDSGIGGCGIGRYAAEAIHVLLVARAGLTDLVVVGVASPGAVGGGIPALFDRVPRHGHLDAHRGGVGRSGIVAGHFLHVGGADAVFCMPALFAAAPRAGLGRRPSVILIANGDLGIVLDGMLREAFAVRTVHLADVRFADA